MHRLIPLLFLFGCTTHKARIETDTQIIGQTCNKLLDVELERYCKQRDDFYFYNYWSLTALIDLEQSEYNRLSVYGKDRFYLLANRLYFLKREQCKKNKSPR